MALPGIVLTTPPLQPLKDCLSISLATGPVMRTRRVVIFHYNYQYLKVLIVRTELFRIKLHSTCSFYLLVLVFTLLPINFLSYDDNLKTFITIHAISIEILLNPNKPSILFVVQIQTVQTHYLLRK